MLETSPLDGLCDAGLVVLSAQDLPALYVELSSQIEFDTSALPPLSDPDFPIVWKPKGALWSSPEVPAQDPAARASTWTRHQDRSGYTHAPHDTGGTIMWEIHPAPDAAVLLIEDDHDSHLLAKLHPTKLGGFSFTALAANGIDALWATLHTRSILGEEPRISRPGGLLLPEPTLYGWDAETVCWLNPAAITGATPHPRGIATDED